MSLQVLPELKATALGAEKDLLRDRRRFDPAFRISQKPLQQLRLRHQGLALHVAGGEAVHRIGDGDKGEGAHSVGDGREVRCFLRAAAEQHRVPRREQGIDVVVPGHDIQ